MNIKSAEVKEPEMFLNIPISIADSAYIETLSNDEGLTFKDLFAKMINEHRKRGFANDTEGLGKGSEDKPTKESSNKKDSTKKSKDG